MKRGGSVFNKIKNKKQMSWKEHKKNLIGKIDELCRISDAYNQEAGG